MADERVLCPTCVQQGLRSIVHEGGSKTTTGYYPPFYDEDGRRHHHDRNIRTRSFRCSKGHSWTDKINRACWCGWTPAERSGSFPAEPPTTAQKVRPASMPDIMLAGSPSEEPPAGYEVACKTDDDGFEFPVEPRTFSRIRPK